MQETDPYVKVTVEIAAAPERVWHVLTAFDRYEAWHPTLSVGGTVPGLVVGALLDLRLSGGTAGDQEFTAEIVEVAAPHRLVWQAGAAGVFFGRHTFELSALPAGGTRLTDTESWTGSMAASVVAEHHAALEAEYLRSADALRAESEGDRAS
jgi:hypothetical protein